MNFLLILIEPPTKVLHHQYFKMTLWNNKLILKIRCRRLGGIVEINISSLPPACTLHSHTDCFPSTLDLNKSNCLLEHLIYKPYLSSTFFFLKKEQILIFVLYAKKLNGGNHIHKCRSSGKRALIARLFFLK